MLKAIKGTCGGRSEPIEYRTLCQNGINGKTDGDDGSLTREIAAELRSRGFVVRCCRAELIDQQVMEAFAVSVVPPQMQAPVLNVLGTVARRS